MNNRLSVEDCISFLISKAHQKITRRARTLLASHGVTPTQYTLLSVLWENDGRSGAELSERLILDSATMTGLIDRSVSSGLVQRKADTTDRRVNRVWLTNRGKELQQPLNQSVIELETEIADCLGFEKKAFNDGLKKYHQWIEAGISQPVLTILSYSSHCTLTLINRALKDV